MAGYKAAFPFSTTFELLVPTYSSVSGVDTKAFPTSGERFYGSFKTYGGTVRGTKEDDVNGVYVIEDTATVETWFRPDIKSDCRIKRVEDGAVFDVMNEPEDIDFRHQFLKFRVKRIKGGA